MIKITSNCNYKKHPLCEYDPIKQAQKPYEDIGNLVPIPNQEGSSLTIEQALSQATPVCRSPKSITFTPPAAQGDMIEVRKNMGFVCKGACTTDYRITFSCPVDVDECDAAITGTNACPGGKVCKDTYGHYICRCPAGTVWNSDAGLCLAPNLCKCTGDPHCDTFAGDRLDFMGQCKYLISGVCRSQEKANVNLFKVECKNRPCGRKGKNVTCTKYCDLTLYRTKGDFNSQRDEIRLGRNGELVVNGERITTGVESQYFSASVCGKVVTVTTPWNLAVWFEGSSRIYVTLPNGYQDKMCGLCGNVVVDKTLAYSLGTAGDAVGGVFTPEFKSKRKHKLTSNSARTFGNSWQVDDPEDKDCRSSNDPFKDCKQEEDVKLRARNMCGKMLDIHDYIIQTYSGPLDSEALKKLINAEESLNNCVFDACQIPDNPGHRLEYICGAMADYAQMTFTETEITYDWRSPEFCGLGCDANTETQLLNAKCDVQCGQEREILMTCEGPPADRCVCANGYKRRGNPCVRESMCGCTLNAGNRVFQLGPDQESYNGDCTQRQKCVNGKLVKIADIPTDPNAICVIDGVDLPELHCMADFVKDESLKKCVRISNCRNGFNKVGEKCIKVSTKPVIWRVAIQDCNADGGHLVNIDDDAFKELLKAEFPKTAELWISGFNPKGDIPIEQNYKNPGFENYKLPYQLYTSDGNKQTAAVTFITVGVYSYKFDFNTRKFNYICEQIPDEEKTTPIGPCSATTPSSDNKDDIETSNEIRMSDPTCICPIPMDVTCADASGAAPTQNITCAPDLDNGELLRCLSDENDGAQCSDYFVSGQCTPNVNECEAGILTQGADEICPPGQECSDDFGAFSCRCPLGNIIVDVDKCAVPVECQLAMEGTDSVRVNTFNSIPYAMTVGDCEITLLEKCDVSDSPNDAEVIYSHNQLSGIDRLTINIGTVPIVIEGLDQIQVSGEFHNDNDEYTTFDIRKNGDEVYITTNDNRVQVIFTDDFTVTVRAVTGACGACSKDSVEEVFTLCTEPGSGSATTNPETATPPQETQPTLPPQETVPTPPPQETTPPPPPTETPGPGPETPTPPIVPELTTTPPPPPTLPATTEAPHPSDVTTPPPAGSSATPATSTSPPTSPPTSACATQMSADDKCGYINDPENPFAKCDNVEILYDMCIKNTCELLADICEALKSSALVCGSYIFTGQDNAEYQMEAGCGKDCGPNMRYSFNPPPIAATCKNKHPSVNTDGAQPRDPACVCNSGFYQEGEECVPNSKCGCLDAISLKYYQNEDSWMSESCTNVYQCKEGVIVTRDNVLIEHAICGESEGLPAPVCEEGYMGDATVVCVKAEEKEDSFCADIPNGESTQRVCLCKKGYVSDCDTCVDLDECQTNKAACNANEKCMNLPGTYTCDCAAGYKRSNLGLCVNINECQVSGGNCPVGSRCIDEPGFYRCQCCYGYKRVTDNSEFRFSCQRDSRIATIGSDCCICNTAQCKPPSDGSPAQVCGTDGVTYNDYKHLYEINCAKNGESNIGVAVEYYGACKTNEPTTTTTTTTTEAPPPLQPSPCSSNLICSTSEINSGPGCAGGQQFDNLCALRMSTCLQRGSNPDQLPTHSVGLCVPITTTTTTVAPTPAAMDFTPWSTWSDCNARPGGLDCGTANGVKERTRDYSGPNPELLTSEMLRETDSCDLKVCPTETPNPEVPNPCDTSDCPKNGPVYCGKVIGVDTTPKTYDSKCHLERKAMCVASSVSTNPDENYPGVCAPGGKRPATLPCEQGPFARTYEYSSRVAQSGTNCYTEQTISINRCNEGICDEGTNNCCRPDEVEFKDITVICVNTATNRMEEIKKKVMSALSCVCRPKDD